MIQATSCKTMPPDSARHTLGCCAPPPWVPPSLAAPTPSPLTRRVLESRRAAPYDGGRHIGGIGELTHTDRYCRTTLTKPRDPVLGGRDGSRGVSESRRRSSLEANLSCGRICANKPDACQSGAQTGACQILLCAPPPLAASASAASRHPPLPALHFLMGGN